MVRDLRLEEQRSTRAPSNPTDYGDFSQAFPDFPHHERMQSRQAHFCPRVTESTVTNPGQTWPPWRETFSGSLADMEPSEKKLSSLRGWVLPFSTEINRWPAGQYQLGDFRLNQLLAQLVSRPCGSESVFLYARTPGSWVAIVRGIQP